MKYRRYIFKRDNDKKAAILPLFIFTYTNVPSQVSVTFLKYCKFSFASASLNKLSCFIISVANSTYADPTAVIIFPSTVTSLFCLYSHSCKCANCFHLMLMMLRISSYSAPLLHVVKMFLHKYPLSIYFAHVIYSR